MADIINFSPDAITVSAEGPASLEQTLDVTGYNDVDLVLLALTLTSAASVTVTMETSMQQNVGWVSLGSFAAVTAINTPEKVRFSGVLRYLRWNVTSLTESAKVTFLLEGMIRL